MSAKRSKSYLASLPWRLCWGAALAVGGFFAVEATGTASEREAMFFGAFMAAICLLPGKGGRYREDAPDGDGGDSGGDGGGGD